MTAAKSDQLLLRAKCAERLRSNGVKFYLVYNSVSAILERYDDAPSILENSDGSVCMGGSDVELDAESACGSFWPTRRG